jgi:hypothetical protein
MSFDVPFDLGPFTVDYSGRIAPRKDNAADGFIFAWRGCPVHARLEERAPGSSCLTLEAALGRIPSTGVSTDMDRRSRSFAALRVLPRSLPARWRLRVLPDHRLRLEAEREVGLPITIHALVTDLTCFLLDLAPFLDLLEEAGVPRGPVWAA